MAASATASLALAPGAPAPLASSPAVVPRDAAGEVTTSSIRRQTRTRRMSRIRPAAAPKPSSVVRLLLLLLGEGLRRPRATSSSSSATTKGASSARTGSRSTHRRTGGSRTCEKQWAANRLRRAILRRRLGETNLREEPERHAGGHRSRAEERAADVSVRGVGRGGVEGVGRDVGGGGRGRTSSRTRSRGPGGIAVIIPTTTTTTTGRRTARLTYNGRRRGSKSTRSPRRWPRRCSTSTTRGRISLGTTTTDPKLRASVAADLTPSEEAARLGFNDPYLDVDGETGGPARGDARRVQSRGAAAPCESSSTSSAGTTSR